MRWVKVAAGLYRLDGTPYRVVYRKQWAPRYRVFVMRNPEESTEVGRYSGLYCAMARAGREALGECEGRGRKAKALAEDWQRRSPLTRRREEA